MLREPSVSWLPYFSSSPGAWTIVTRVQSASISSATIMGRLVRGPGPISARWATIETVPDDALLACAQRLRKNDRDQVVAAPRQLRAFECLIVNKLHRTAVGFHPADS